MLQAKGWRLRSSAPRSALPFAPSPASPLTLREPAGRLSQQHWEEGSEARRRYVTAIFVRLDAAASEMEIVNAGHNPAFWCPQARTRFVWSKPAARPSACFPAPAIPSSVSQSSQAHAFCSTLMG